jgi:AcrR family transcriptional regulator
VSDGAETRARLVEATIEVIATRGEAAVRMVEIAAAAGIKQPSIYYFFPSREDLVVAAHRERYRRAVAEVIGRFEAEFAEAKSAEEFREGSVRALQFALSDERSEARAVRLGLLAKALTNDELLREVNDAAHEGHVALAAILERAQRAGWVRGDVSPLTLAVWVRSLIFGRLVLEVAGDRYDGDEWTRLAISSFSRTLDPG